MGATCALDAQQTITFLAMFGIGIARASNNCDRVDRVQIAPKEDRVVCATGVMDVLESFFMAASFLSSAVSHCNPKTNQQALCAQGALGLAGGLAGMAKNGMNIWSTCNGARDLGNMS